jgi:hypothetical protein
MGARRRLAFTVLASAGVLALASAGFALLSGSGDSVRRDAGNVRNGARRDAENVRNDGARRDAGKPRRRTHARALWTGVPFRAKNPGPVTDPAGAPWTASGCANNGYSLVDRPDGTGVFELHQGDRPPNSVGGDRCQLSILDPYVIGMPATPNPEARWYRFDVAVPAEHPYIKPVYYQTLVEWHGAVAGPAALKIAITGGNQLELTTLEKVLGVDGQPEHWDVHALAPGSWHSYAVELLTSPNPAVGYFRLYRDGVCRTCGDPRADAQGRVWRRTARTSATGEIDKNSFSIGYYRDKAITVATKSLYRNVRIGRTLADVAPKAASRDRHAK